jgi:hypothetical protein
MVRARVHPLKEPKPDEEGRHFGRTVDGVMENKVGKH